MEVRVQTDPEIVDVSDKFSSDLDFGIQQTLTANSKDLLDFLKDEPVEIKKETVQETIVEDKEKDKSTEEIDPKKQMEDEFSNFLFGKEAKDEDSVENKTTEIVDETNDSEEETEDPEENTFSILSRQLYESGVLTLDEDEEMPVINDAETFLEKFQEEKKKGAIEVIDNFLSRYGEDYREMFDAVFVKGVDPKEYIKAHNTVQSFKDMDLSNEDNQKTVFIEFHRQLGLSDEQIKKRLDKAIDYADLEEDAKTFHEKLVEREEAKLQELQTKEEEKRKEALRADQLYNQNLQTILQEKLKAKEFDGIPLTPKIAQDAYSYMYNKKYRTASGEELAEFDKFLIDLKKPENHELRVKVGLLAMNHFDLSKVKASQDSKDKKKLFEGLDKSKVARKVQKQEQTPQNRSFFD